MYTSRTLFDIKGCTLTLPKFLCGQIQTHFKFLRNKAPPTISFFKSAKLLSQLHDNAMQFYSYGSIALCVERYCKKKWNGFGHFNAPRSSFKVPASATPNEDDRGSMLKRVCVSEKVVTSCQESQNPSSSATVVSVLAVSFPRQKKLKLAKQYSRQAGKIYTWRFDLFLKWRHSSPIFHYEANFIACGQSGHQNLKDLLAVWTLKNSKG